jgi:DNA-binding IclR family transcriptional regulator
VVTLPDKSVPQNGSSAQAEPPEVGGELVDERYLVPALTRGLQILKMMSDAHRRLTLSEVAVALGVTRSSAYRLAYTLCHLGFLEYDAQRKTYALGPQVLHLGYGYLASRDLVEVAMPHLVRLRDRTGWSAHIGELQGKDLVYLARVATRRTIASTVHVGTRLPARMTTMGRILLSGLPAEDVGELYRDEQFGPVTAQTPTTVTALLAQLAVDRANGVVVQNSGYEPGVASVAAPIRDMTDRIVAAVNISAVALFTNDAELQGPLKAEVLAAADAISRDLGRKTQPGLAVGEPR